MFKLGDHPVGDMVEKPDLEGKQSINDERPNDQQWQAGRQTF
jgi:hypothetical protein